MKVIRLSSLPQRIQDDLREFVHANPGRFDSQPVQEIWGLKDALDAYLGWNGIRGYTGQLMKIFDAAYEEKVQGRLDEERPA